MTPEPGQEAGAAPVARFESIGSEQPPSSVARFERVGAEIDTETDAELPAPRWRGIAGTADEPAAPVAELGAVAASRSELPRVARLGELGVAGLPGRVRRDPARRSPAERPASGSVSEPRAVPGPDVGSGPGVVSEPRARRARRPSRDAAPGPGFGPGPEEPSHGPEAEAEAEPSGAAGSGRRARRGWGQPAELPPGTDPVAAAREICLRLLADRARTRLELGQALRRKGVPDEAAASVLERFDEVGLIDDAAFAGQWVRSRHNHKGLARRAIAMELRRKGVDDDVAGEALAEVDPESEEQRADELVRRKLRSLPVETPEQRASATRRLVGMLARKGYGSGTAYRVVRQALAEHGTELEEEYEPGAD